MLGKTTLKKFKMRKKPSARPVDPRKRLRRRLFVGALALPPVVVAALGLNAARIIYADNHSADASLIPLAAVPHPPQRLLVFAPHCDDETLGVAGLMKTARQNGCDVKVVICTNGDGFRVGVERTFHKLSVGSADFIRYGYLRQQEARVALGVLGVPRDHIVFLGYPDRGLMHMWTDNWSPDSPYRSAFTLANRSPYNDSFTPAAIYCGASILSDIKEQLEEDKPTDIYVTHPSDDHPDHAAASVFVKEALDELRAKREPWAEKATLRYYLVHRGDWPIPQGLSEDNAMPPPAQMASIDTKWEQFPLSKYLVERKYAAIKRYRSQVEVTARFLYSFARKNELFGTLLEPQQPAIQRVENGTISFNDPDFLWRSMPLVIMDPVADSVGRAFQAGGDIQSVRACRDSSTLFVRATMRDQTDSRTAYTLVLRPVLGSRTSQPATTMTVIGHTSASGTPLASHPGIYWRRSGRNVDFKIPLTYCSVSDQSSNRVALYMEVATSVANMSIDNTGFRGGQISGPSMTARAYPEQRAGRHHTAL